jgi:hypothetical protein
MDNIIQYPLYRDELFSKAKRFSDYEKLKVLHRSICRMIDHVKESLELYEDAVMLNKRQQSMRNWDQNNYNRLLRQKTRLEEKMKSYEELIRKDIEFEK